MATAPAAAQVNLEAKSPYEMRVHLGDDVPETDVRTALRTGDMGFLHSYTTGSAVDGPGIRVVAWTTACMFRCRYCHNPDTWTLSNGIPVTLERAIDGVRKYAPGLKLMHGGFTLSGGEPLMQHRFAARLLAAVNAMGVHTAIETNGYYGENLSDDEIRNIDLVILDMKAFTRTQHERVTGGMHNEDVLEFCNRLSELKRPMWLRYVLVPGLTDIQRKWKRSRSSAPRSAWSSAPRSCRSISSASTSGNDSGWTTSWRIRRPRPAKRSRARSTSSARRD